MTTTYTDVQVFARNSDGTLQATTLTLLDGEAHLGGQYGDIGISRCGVETLQGWGEMSGEADVYKTAAGREILVPERDTTCVRNRIAG